VVVRISKPPIRETPVPQAYLLVYQRKFHFCLVLSCLGLV
jgi:hypothetical protein